MARTWISRRAAMAAAVTVLLAGIGTTLAGTVPAEQTAPVLAVIAILAYVAGHLSGERRVRWLSPVAAELGLGVTGSSTVLAQVLTNVLSNCAGLAISRRLLEAEGAAISIRSRSVSQPGCTVLLELPAAQVTPSVPTNVIMMESA